MKIKYATTKSCPHCGANDWSKAKTDYLGSRHAYICNYCNQITILHPEEDKKKYKDDEKNMEIVKKKNAASYYDSTEDLVYALVLAPAIFIATLFSRIHFDAPPAFINTLLTIGQVGAMIIFLVAFVRYILCTENIKRNSSG